MRPSFTTIRKWITDPNSDISLDQLRELSSLVEQRRAYAESHEDRVQQALQQAADNLGVPVEELVKRTAPVNSSTRKTVDGVRRPYLNPYKLAGDDEDEVQLVFLANKRMPPWAEALLKNGWDKEDFRYNRIQKKMAAAGMKCNFDPVAIYEKRVKAEKEAPRPSRLQKRK